MKRIMLFLASLLMAATLMAQNATNVPPEFPGGEDSLFSYLSSNIRYPQYAIDNNITGEVVVAFVVEKDGTVSNAKCVQDIGGGCGDEAVRVISAMPRWKPGMKDGAPVRFGAQLPVTFNFELKKPTLWQRVRSWFSKSDE